MYESNESRDDVLWLLRGLSLESACLGLYTLSTRCSKGDPQLQT